MSRRRRGPALLLALLGLAACSGPGSEERLLLHDLVAEHDLAEVRAEPGVIDLGTPAARGHLASGWSWDESAGDGASFVWSEGGESALDLFFAAPREIELRFRAFPFAHAGAPAQAVEVLANGRRAAAVELAPGPSEHAVRLPAALLAAGANRLVFRYRWSRSPAAVGAGSDRRRLAVGWDWIRFGDGEGAAPPRADAAAGTLLLPAGTQVDHFLDLPAGSVLGLEALGARGAKGRLEVLLAPDGGAEEVVARLAPGSRSHTLELPLAGRSLARLSLRAAGEEGRAAGGMVLTRPRLLAPAAAAEAGPPTAGGRTASPEATGLPAGPPPPSVPRPSVLLYLVDTLRADRLGCYGYPRPTSPRLDAFAGRAFLFERAFADTSWTKPAVATLLTGLPPRRHGVNGLQDGLPEGVALLAELLGEAGWDTAGFTANAHVSPASGFARGFDRFEYRIEEPDDAAALNRRALAWLDGREEARAFFLFVHTLDPHAPYQPPAPFRGRLAGEVADPGVGSVESIRAMARREVPVTPQAIADLEALYDAEVAANDAAFGALLDGLTARGLAGQTLVAFVSDHGEAFHEHGVLGHGWDLYGEVLRIPLLLRLPGQRQGRRVARPVQQADLAPTLLAALGLAVPPEMPGRDLLLLAAEEAGAPAALPDHRPLYAYMDYEGREGASLVLGEWHLIEPLSGRFGPAPELYHLGEDPGESADRAGERPVVTGYLRRLLRAHLAATAGAAVPTRVDLEPETRRRLQALGYL